MALSPRRAPTPEPLKPPVALWAAGALILVVVAGLLWWANGSAWAAQDRCLDAGGRWADGACVAEPGPAG